MKRTGNSKIAVVGWGRGMGHKGHMYLASSVITQAKRMNADPYFFVSKTVGKDDPIFPEEKVEIYQKVFPQYATIFQPQGNLNKALEELAQLGYQGVVVVVGADQKQAFQYLERPNKEGVPVYQSLGFKKLKVISRQETGDESAKLEGPRATPMREILLHPEATEEQKFKVWRDAMPEALNDQKVLELMRKAEARLMGSHAKTKKLEESLIMHPDAKIDAYYIAPAGQRLKVAKGITYPLLQKLVIGLKKKYNIDMADLEIRPSDVNQYKRSSLPDLAEQELDEYAMSPSDDGDNRSKLISTIARLLHSGKKVDFFVPGIRGHITGVSTDGTTIHLKRWKKPYSKTGLALQLDSNDDKRFGIKVVDPDYYQVVLIEHSDQDSLDEGFFDRFKKKPAQPDVADPGNYPRIGSDINQWMIDTVEYHKAKFPDTVWKLFCPTYPDYLPVRVRVGTSENIMRQHLDDYINLRNQNPEAVRIARQKFDKNNTYPSGPRDDYTNKVVDEAYDGFSKFDAAEFQRHMEKLRAREELRKTDPMRALVGDLKDQDAEKELAIARRKKPEDDSMSINDPRHPGYAYTQMGQTDLNEFAPGNGDDDRPTKEYEVYQCQLDDQFDWIGGPLMQTDDMAKAHNFAYFLWKKHPDKCFMIWQERSQGSRGGYGPEGSVLAPSKEVDEGYIFKGGFPFNVDHMPGSVIRNRDETTDIVKTKNKDKWDDMVDLINDEVFDDMSDFRTNDEGETVTGNSAVWAKWDNSTQTGWINRKGQPLKPWPVKEQEVEEAGITRRGILKGIAGAGALGAAGKAGAIAGAFPTPSHQAAMYKAAADSNAAQARADAAAKAKADKERLAKNTPDVERLNKVNYHGKDAPKPTDAEWDGDSDFLYLDGTQYAKASRMPISGDVPPDIKLISTREGRQVYIWTRNSLTKTKGHYFYPAEKPKTIDEDYLDE